MLRVATLRVAPLRVATLRGATVAAALFLAPVAVVDAQERPALLGRWDLTAEDSTGSYPSWLEVTTSGRGVLVGRWQGRVGSARPVSRIEWIGGVARFSIPPQWEDGEGDLRFHATVEGNMMTGVIVNPNGSRNSFRGTRAPALRRENPARWGRPDTLFNGRDLTGWTTQGGVRNNWTVTGGVLTNTRGGGANLMTTKTFEDFRLHIEFRYPPRGNSGIYLRGRHEVQVEDNTEQDMPLPTEIGGVYGFLWPNENAATGPGQWQTYDITLVGRRVTIVLNGKTVVNDQIIPGPTGGAIDSHEGAPGPILLQGDHTAVEFRNIVLTPAATSAAVRK